MTWFVAALWGLFGGFMVEGFDLYATVLRRGQWPWRANGPRAVGALAYFVAELLRLLISAGLATAMAAGGQINTPFGAIAVGVAAPLIAERIFQNIPLANSTQDVGAKSNASGETVPENHSSDNVRE